MTIYRELRVTVILTVRPWPPSEPTQTFRLSGRAASRADGFVEGRVQAGGYGELLRSLSDFDGSYDVDVWRFELDDHDRAIRTLLRDPSTRNWKRWEVRAEAVSDVGQKAGAVPRVLTRARVNDVSLGEELAVTLEVRDLLGVDLDRQLPLWRWGDDWSDLAEFNEEAKDKVVPLIYGENSDHGATVDGLPTGTPAEKGLVGARFLGKKLIHEGYPGTPGTAPIYANPPGNLTITVHNSGGRATHTVRCGVTALTVYGETTLSNIVTVTNYPKMVFADSETPGDPEVDWEWDAPDNCDPGEIVGYRMYVIDESSTATPRYRVDMNYNPAGNASTTYTDDGDDPHDKRMYPPPPTKNTAQVAAGTPGTPGSGPLYWDVWGVCAGAVPWDVGYDFFASDIAQGNSGSAPSRVLFTEAERRASFVMPNDPEWPHDDPWVVRNGRRFSVFYGRGTVSTHAKEGIVGLALNLPGYAENADATGDVINQAFYIQQHLLSNWGGLDIDQTTYKDGAWLGLPLFADGVERLQSSRFQACQATSAARLGTALGYVWRFVIDEPMTLGELLALFTKNSTAPFRSSCHGQLGPVLIDETLDPASGALWRDRIEVKRWLRPIVDNRVCSRMNVVYDWDSEMRRFRDTLPPIEDRDLGDEYGGHVTYWDDPLELRLIGDKATAQDVSARTFRLFRRPRTVQPVVLGLMGLASDLGDVRRLTHYNGPGSAGDVETPGFLVSHRLAIDAEEVTAGLLDLTEIRESEQEALPMITTVEFGGSHVTAITATAWADVSGTLKPPLRAGDFYNWTLSVKFQRWTTGSGTVQLRLVDEGDNVVAVMPAPSSNTTEGGAETVSSVTLPATTQAVRLQGQVSAGTEAHGFATLIATRT